jgi:FSR family fosmidomycin resistance protein-like MFS transporter
MADKTPPKLLFPITYGIMHAFIDASCVMVIFSTIFVHDLSPYMSFYMVVSYDVLAFAGQAFFGYLADRLGYSRGIVLAGIIMTALSVVFLKMEPVTAMIAAGVGNALFHVGAGALALYVVPGRATAPGIFVAPGALGLGFGIWMGKSGDIYTWPFLIVLAASFIYALFSSNPKLPYKERPKRLDIEFPYLIMALLLFSIAIRSMVGYAGGWACPKLTWVPAAFALAAFGGKAVGGIVSDRLGWIEASVGALLLSAPLIAFFGANPVVLVIGLFFFQMTMPVTLVALVSVLPGRPAFVFGIACLVLVLGALPTYYPQTRAFYSPYAFLMLILASAGAIFYSLRLLNKKVPMKFG